MAGIGVDRFFLHVLQVGNGRRIEIGDDPGGIRQFTDATVHPGHIDHRAGFLLLEFGQGGGRGADLLGDGNPGRLRERFCNTFEERLTPVAAIQRNGQLLLFGHDGR
ncbi:hypothetical protein D3C87_1675310 [compost metagenome]